MQRAGSITPLLGALAGPIAWAAHFSLLYAAATLACLTPEPNEPAFRMFALVLTLVMVAGLSWFLVRRTGTYRRDPQSNRFLHIVAIALAAISILAMLWTALPVAMIGHCTA
jgi:hypothetical protein